VGIVGLFYSCVERTVVTWIDYTFYGFVQGAASIGMYKIAQFTPGIPIARKEML